MDLHTIAVVIVAALHGVFFILESLLWTSPKVIKLFGTTAEEAQATRVLALNQGFYNLGASALLLGLHAIDNRSGVMAVLLFLTAMGVVGAITANWRIIMVQSLPALAALLLFFLA